MKLYVHLNIPMPFNEDVFFFNLYLVHFFSLFSTLHFYSMIAMYKSFSFNDVVPGTCSNPNTESSSLLSPAFMKNNCGVRETADRMSEECCGVLAVS